MKPEYIGEYGEIAVYKELLKQNYEVYRAASKIQEGWDIVVINNDQVIRIQVKTTILENKSTNNSFKIHDNYNILVLVVLSLRDEELSKQDNFYIMTKNEVMKIQGNNKLLSTTSSKGGKCTVIKEISENVNKWNKIKEFKNGKNN
ncbi:MAG: hypothetical protein EKK57_04250 [Proteobacteria bacterium]|nr:MAG: hypothetical protein EKK57_04250 [Pseudomonadota bacterium]